MTELNVVAKSIARRGDVNCGSWPLRFEETHQRELARDSNPAALSEIDSAVNVSYALESSSLAYLNRRSESRGVLRQIRLVLDEDIGIGKPSSPGMFDGPLEK
jgi:hypothetical protein